MLAHCRPRPKKIFAGESLKQFRRVFRKRKWLEFSEVARGTVNRWIGMVERAGQRALKARRRGRPAVSRLKPHQAATTVRHILSGCPDQLSLPFALWTREAVQELLTRKFDVEVSVWTVGRYLRAWGLTPQKAGATSVRTKSGGGTEMVGAGDIPRFENRRASGRRKFIG